ncbi:hypothetical protein BDK51DRAFT_46853 [Blyttiomyces helicus]|uniref:TATA element modulatory factor 1 TATA binding domain-containing protein n=1 Tax=Blyttiomyces helicus TaxID=388810 RepID=A0A4V1IQ23_9FUNG|nr:hypothetical protein BDK51DRAFT_46853 [Blyttiomyces helicus]|eukprot:RKO85057.1 hypothetical protein BDK51DRAFT_46853 [Blyttiomyces helicus]
MRLQAADARAEDLSHLGQEASRPLLRQIEALQTQHNSAVKSWEQIEQRWARSFFRPCLTHRLHEAEADRAMALEKERALVERVNELTSRVSLVEAQSSRERQEKSRLMIELQAAKLRTETLEQETSDLTATLDHIKATHTRALEETKENYQRMLRQQLAEEREQLEEKHRAEEAARVAKENERQKLRLDISRRGSQAAGTRRTDSGSPLLSSYPESFSRSSLDMATPSSAALGPSVMIDRLHTNVKQLEGQLSSLQTQLQMATQTRDELAEELVKVTNENEELYLAALELLGERTEEVEELRQDIKDVKDLYKGQVDTLLAQLEAQRAA